MLNFLDSLFADGDLTIAASDSVVCSEDVESSLISFEKIWRMQWPLSPPPFEPSVAAKAARILLTTCRAVVHREIGVEQTELIIREIGLVSIDSASVHYSADLLLRFLPQVTDRAARISESDPVLEVLRATGRQWPLSSIGIKGCEPEHIPTALQHPSLWRMYVDRVISRKDVSRLNIPAVRESVAASVGPFANLAPEFAGLLSDGSENSDRR